ncbi:Rad4-domain-containing protein [Xylariaceae sp. FL0016]|nr:Rad4-domain-containing protein [Xylariaceae sp. FL0016]
MPPLVPRKRLCRTPSPDTTGHVTKKPKKALPEGRGKSTRVAPPRKPTLFEDLDAVSKKGSAEKTEAALQQMHDDDDDSSSLSSLSDVEFEDVPSVKRQKTLSENEDDDDDDDMEFEDVPAQERQENEPELQDLELTLHQHGSYVPLASELGKKGPTKRQKAIRVATHCIHVQFLLWHNATRNSWLCDEEVQATMISHLSPRLWEEVDRWRRNSGLGVAEDPPKKETKSKRNVRGKRKSASSQSAPGRDWGDAADRLERGVPDMSHGDPLFRLIKCLLSWWKQRFRVTAPGLRKHGYMNTRRLGKWTEAYKNEDHDPERFGERIANVNEFRALARDCTGSRDVGSQLFTALLRGLGLEARMVANLQTLGFGWSKIEEANDEKPTGTVVTNGDSSTQRKKPSKKVTPIKPASRRKKKNDDDALQMDLDESDEYAEPLTESEDEEDSSIVDITERMRPKRAEAKPYDKDLDFPNYWTEVLSPVTNKYLPVDPIVKSVVASSRDLVESLEPRGGKADKSKQIMAYCVGFSKDGTAKDVTVRYLKKQIFPGKTKGVRMAEEKVPVYNKHGKVRRYEHFDWFKSIMRGYARGHKGYPIDEIDEMEESTDLKPAKPEKKEVKEGEETLQYYKTSKEFVLARHLKREEALLPDAEPVKKFRNKGKGNKVEEEDVFLRKDVVAVKSAETWHKQGRAPIDGAHPLKHAPYRAATTNRRREIAEAEARTGEKVMQPLYSLEQTDWIIPPPIENGIIPKNEYGNIDMFAEHMCPEGAIHVPYRGAVRVCKRLEIDYAEAVVGFEFGHRMAVPVIHGVVIAEENYEHMIEELEKDEAERARKEDEKRRKAALNTWRRFLFGLRIADRIKKDYGDLDDSVNVFGHDNGEQEGEELYAKEMREHDEEMAGGFLPEGYEEEEPGEKPREEPRQMSGFFPSIDDEDGEGEDPFEVEYGHQEKALETEVEAIPEPQSEGEEQAPARKAPKKAVPKARAKAKPRQSTRRRTRKMQIETSEEDDDGDDDFLLDDSDDE